MHDRERLTCFTVRDVHYYRCDVTDTDAVVALCEEIRQTHGSASVLVNNAGIGIGKTVLEARNHCCMTRLMLTLKP
jgi:NAD(P)-dependent dehydrogenase (short-subunit alcohol dehydrogenase family)